VAALGTPIAFATLAACASRQPAGPEATLEAFRAALLRGDGAGAYALLAPSTRATLSQAQFVAQLRDNPRETAELAQDLAEPAPARVSAELDLPDAREPVELERANDGSWRIRSALTAFYPTDTPRAALRSFVRAVERERWDVVFELMPEADRAGLDRETLAKHLAGRREELTRLVALLEGFDGAPIEIVGERATMPYGESFTVRFVRESDGWKIEDPE
jgi:hypothetical protein